MCVNNASIMGVTEFVPTFTLKRYWIVKEPLFFQMTTPSRRSGRVYLPTPKRSKRSSLPATIPDRFKQMPPSARKSAELKRAEPLSPNFEGITSGSFYKRASTGTNAESAVTENSAAAAQPVMKVGQLPISDRTSSSRRASQRNSLPARRRSVGSVPRRKSGSAARPRSDLGIAGVSHGIKRPKRKPKSIGKSFKISELAAQSIEIPQFKTKKTGEDASPSTPAAASKSASAAPKTGNLIVNETRLQVEVKAGEMTFRKCRVGSKTPSRIAPREEELSPLKQSYFGLTTPRSRSKDKKLFSPSGNFLDPMETGSSPKKFIPSPVKFHASADDVRTNIYD